MPKGERKSNREVKKPKKVAPTAKAASGKSHAPPPRSMSSVIRVSKKA